ncbi:MAG: hypothetical protein AAFU85_27285 [Planctomycetota bacterium]
MPVRVDMFRLPRFFRMFALFVALTAVCRCAVANEPCEDRTVLVSTRHLTSDVCRAEIECPDLRFWSCDTGASLSLQEYEAGLRPDRPVVVYLHGNRMPASELMKRFQTVRSLLKPRLCTGGVDWLVYSWPSERTIKGIDDFRLKASRCDAQGLYLAWLLRRQVERGVSVNLVGYSFGARVATGALHSLGGGSLGGRRLSGETIAGARMRVALVAPAIDSGWLAPGGYHQRAAGNLGQILLLFNPRDVVLKRYWLVAGRRGNRALGVTGLQSLAPGADGECVPVRSCDFSPAVGIRHAELGYYMGTGNAAREVAWLINDVR